MIKSREPTTPPAMAIHVAAELFFSSFSLVLFPVSLAAAGGLVLVAEMVLSALFLVLVGISNVLVSSSSVGEEDASIVSVVGESRTLCLVEVVEGEASISVSSSIGSVTVGRRRRVAEVVVSVA
jgi:hypothetical protein